MGSVNCKHLHLIYINDKYICFLLTFHDSKPKTYNIYEIRLENPMLYYLYILHILYPAIY